VLDPDIVDTVKLCERCGIGRPTRIQPQDIPAQAAQPQQEAAVPAEEPFEPQGGEAGPLIDDLESNARRDAMMTDILREISFAETISISAPNISTRFTQTTQKVSKPTLLIGIPKETKPTSGVGGVCEAVRNKLAALGRTDVLVMPVDRYNMEYELKKLNCPYGVILDIDNTGNVDKLLENFLDELDLQALYKEYDLTRDVRRIVLDSRLIPTIKSLKLDYIMTHGVKSARSPEDQAARNSSPREDQKPKTILTYMEIGILEDKSKEVIING